jgi:hypothetical protein
LADSFEASLRRLRKRDRERELTIGDLRADPPLLKAPAPSVAIQAQLSQGRGELRFRWLGIARGRCLEVVHARSGTRFVLSQDGSAWLLSIESENASDAAALAMLKDAFMALGLGPVDVILD